MVECRHMEQPQFHHDTSPAPTTTPPSEDSRDQTADAPATPVPDAAASRHLYTMTVDDVSAELIAYDLHRDSRTIQRWCKGGKLRAIIDHEHGDRYLIDPGSVRDMVTTLLEERDSRERHVPPPRHRPDDAGSAPRHGDHVPPQFQFTPQYTADKERDRATTDTTAAATPDESRDEIAALQQKIAELEKEKAMLSVDKQVREQMVDYLKENFQKMLDQALDRTEQLGQLQAENAQLRALLPQPADPRRPEPPDYDRRADPPQPPPSMHNRGSWSRE